MRTRRSNILAVVLCAVALIGFLSACKKTETTAPAPLPNAQAAPQPTGIDSQGTTTRTVEGGPNKNPGSGATGSGHVGIASREDQDK